MSSDKNTKRAAWRKRLKRWFHSGTQTPELNATSTQLTYSFINKTTYSTNTPTEKNTDDDPGKQAETILLAAPSGTTPLNSQNNRATWKGLRSLLQVLESAGNGFGPLKDVIAQMNNCFDHYDRAAKGHKGYNQLSADLDSLFCDLQGFLESPVSPTITQSIRSLCVSLESELQWVYGKQRRGITRRYLEALEDADALKEAHQRIHGLVSRLVLNMNMGLWKTLDEQVTEERLNKLSPSLSAVYNSAQSDVIDRGPCTPGTRTAELGKILSWINHLSTNCQSVYWLNGMAGTGKTTIAYSLCTQIDENGKLAASFFCSRTIPECRNVKLIIPTLAYQIARFSHPFRSALSQALVADPDAHTRSLKVQFDSLIAKPSIQIQDALPADLMVVIDALDECENENSIGQILDIIFSSNIKTPIRFLISSRPEPEIYRRMMTRLDGDSNSLLVLHELDAARVQHDIETYLRQELEEVPLTTAQLSGVVEKSGVLFIYASTVARYIKDGLLWSAHEERVDAILGLSTLFDGGAHQAIDDLYATILHTVLRNPKLNESNRSVLKALLDIVVCVQEPVTSLTLSGLLRLEGSQQVEGLLRPLYSVIHITEKTGLVKTLHASFADFMLNSHRSWDLCCNPLSVHRWLAQACFAAIKENPVQFNICGLPSSNMPDSRVPNILYLVEKNISSKLFYACRYWETHMEIGETNETIRQSLHDFLASRLLLWIEVLNLHEHAHTGVSILLRLEAWCKASTLGLQSNQIVITPEEQDYAPDVLELAHDAWWFTTTFANHPVSSSTPHLYTSMLPFWPSSNPISKCYSNRLRHAVSITGTAIERRQLSLLASWSYGEDTCRADVSPDGAQVVLNVGARVLVVDSTTGQSLLGPLEGHHDLVHWVEFSPDGSRIVSGSRDGTVRLWESRSGKLSLGPLDGHNGAVLCVRFSHHGALIAASMEKAIMIWDSDTGEAVVGPFTGHTGSIRTVVFFPDDICLLSGDDDGVVRVWNILTGEKISSHHIHSGVLTSISLSPDGSLAVLGCEDFTANIWDPVTGEIVMLLNGHTNSVEAVRFSPNGLWIATVSSDLTVRVWDVQSRQTIIGPLEGHTDTILSVTFTSDNSRLVTCSKDRTVRVWDLETAQHNTHPPSEHTHWVMSVCFSRDGTRIISGSCDKTICVWDAEDGRILLGPLEGHQGVVYSVDISPDDSRMVSGSGDCTIRMWDAQNGKVVLGPIEAHTRPIYSVAFSPDGQFFASCSADCAIRLWDSQTGKRLIEISEAHPSSINRIQFSPDGSRLVSCSDDQTVCIWDTSTGTIAVGPMEGHTDLIYAVAFSPDGLNVVSGSSDCTLRLWDSRTGQSTGIILEGHTDLINSVDFSPDGAYIASCANDFSIRIWEISSGQMIAGPLQADPNYINSVRFSPDGKSIVSSGADSAIRVWNFQTVLENAKPKANHANWTLDSEGWIKGSQSEYLAWVPPDLRTSLLRPQNTVVVSPHGWLKLAFDGSNIEADWVHSYEPVC